MSQELSQQNYDNNEVIRTAVNQLTDLLEWLHPEPSPDIFTVRDYRNRYPFTRLGSLATGDIDRYQRINRVVGNHVQMGLCEYHIGLIYLHEGDFRGAAQQLAQARQQWSFVNQPAAVSLTFLGQAIALQQANHFESALVSAGKVAAWLDRARFAEPILGGEQFRERVMGYVAGLQAALRQQLDAASQADAQAPAAPPAEPARQSSAASAATTVDDTPTMIEVDLEAETKPDGEIVSGSPTPLPISNMAQEAPHLIPMPGHTLVDARYDWYLVETRPLSSFMSDINVGDWLLVDLQPGLTSNLQDTEQPILVMMNKEIDDTIRVRPLDPKARFQRIYLVKWADSPVGSFRVDEATGAVDFSPELLEIGINLDEILGVVVGFWRPMIEFIPSSRV